VFAGMTNNGQFQFQVGVYALRAPLQELPYGEITAEPVPIPVMRNIEKDFHSVS